MSNVITELAVITSKAKGAANNKDSVNMNGRVLTLQEADKGYKGAGSFNAPCVLALASSVRDGYSAAALTALNERMQSIRDSESGFKNAIDLYFSDASYALTRLDAGENALSLAVLYTYGNSISVARLGGDVIYQNLSGCTFLLFGLRFRPVFDIGVGDLVINVDYLLRRRNGFNGRSGNCCSSKSGCAVCG